MTHTSNSGEHRLRITIEDGRVMLKLIHPETGCAPATICAHCGRDRDDPESGTCYDCKDGWGSECWAQDWMDNLMPDELLHGTVSMEVPVALSYTNDGLALQVGEASEVS